MEKELDPPIIQYVFPKNGVEFRCDMDERISAVFVDADELDGLDKGWLEVEFDSSRDQVRHRFGKPSKSGEGLRDAILGDFGAWDRFTRADHPLHVEYRSGEDRIRRVTIMRPDVVP